MIKKIGSSFLLLLLISLISCTTKTYQIKYIVDDTIYYEEEVNLGEFLNAPNEPFKEGSSFSNWIDENGNVWDFSVDKVKKNKTFKPFWVKVNKSSQVYLQNTLDEFEIFRYESDVEGPTIFIIAGIHGDERAGWMAGLQLKDFKYLKGTIYLLPLANNKAINSEPPKRYVGKDLNRTFPGTENNTSVDLLAFTIYEAIKASNPDLVIDMHESRGSYNEGYLGDQIIAELGKYNLYLYEVIAELSKLELLKDNPRFRIDSAPPTGSINKEFSQREGIPVFTLETNRGGLINNETIPLDKRIAIQLALVEIIINTFKPI